jgi:hypothetical protein
VSSPFFLQPSRSLLTRLYSLQAIAGPYYQYTAVETCQVLSAPKEIDPRAVAWKGASVLGRLEASSEFWVTQAEWVSHFQRWFVLPSEAHAAFRTCWECVLSVTGHSSCSFHCIPARVPNQILAGSFIRLSAPILKWSTAPQLS